MPQPYARIESLLEDAAFGEGAQVREGGLDFFGGDGAVFGDVDQFASGCLFSSDFTNGAVFGEGYFNQFSASSIADDWVEGGNNYGVASQPAFGFDGIGLDADDTIIGEGAQWANHNLHDFK